MALKRSRKAVDDGNLYFYMRYMIYIGLLDNLLLLLGEHNKGRRHRKTLYCDTVAIAGAGAARLTCSTVGTCSGRRRVSPVCYLVTVAAGQLY